MADHIDIVFEQNDTDPILEFVEIEIGGKSVRVGEWQTYRDNLLILRITSDDIKKLDTGND